MVRLENGQKPFTIGVIGYKRFWRTICSEWIKCIEFEIEINVFEMFISVQNDELDIIIMKILLETVL